MGKSVDYLVTLLAIWRIGAVQVPLFTAFAPPAIAYRLAASECELIVCDPSQRCKLEFGASAPVNASWRILCTTGAQSGDLSLPDWISTGRSEEHTSELQSLMRISYAVFCLNNTTINKW